MLGRKMDAWKWVDDKGKVRGKDMLPGIKHPGKHSKATVLFKHMYPHPTAGSCPRPGIKPRSITFEGERSTNWATRAGIETVYFT